MFSRADISLLLCPPATRRRTWVSRSAFEFRRRAQQQGNICPAEHQREEVETYKARAMEKLGYRSQVEVVRYAAREGMVAREISGRAVVRKLPDIVGTTPSDHQDIFRRLTADLSGFLSRLTDAPFPSVQLTGPRRRTAPVSGCALHTRRRGPCPDERLQFPGAPAGHGDAKRGQGTIAGPARAAVIPQRLTHRGTSSRRRAS